MVCRMLVSQFAICDRRLKAKMKISGVDLLLLFYIGPRCVSAGTGLLRGVGNVVVEEDFRRLQTVGSIADFDLVNAKTNLKITTLTPGQVIVVSAIPGMISPDFNIDAKSTGSVQSVVFTLNGVKVQTENAAPWAFCGNSGPDFLTCKSLINGTHTITATSFSGKDGTGTKGTTASVTFTIVSTLPASPTKSPIAPTKNPVAPVAPTKSPVVAPMASPVAIAAPTVAPTKSPVESTKNPVVAPTGSPTAAPQPAVSPLLINCGGESYTDSLNRVWVADQFFDSGTKVFSTGNNISNTVEDTLYQSERYGISMTYSIPRPAGLYTVTLHFAEI
jgi:Malectin domain